VQQGSENFLDGNHGALPGGFEHFATRSHSWNASVRFLFQAGIGVNLFFENKGWVAEVNILTKEIFLRH
jgi:hypothetical protein